MQTSTQTQEHIIFTHRTSIYIPSTINIDTPINASKQIADAQKFLTKLCGGATTIQSTGCYLTSDGKLVTETITMVIGFSDKSIEKEAIVFCKNVAKEMHQECISLEINGKLMLIEP